MFYYKKLVNDGYEYHACSIKPPRLDGLVEITAEEYAAAIEELNK